MHCNCAHSENSRIFDSTSNWNLVFSVLSTNSGYYWLSSFVRISRLLLTQSIDHWRYAQTERRKVKKRTLILSSSNYVCHKSFIFRYFFRSFSDFCVLGSSLLNFFRFCYAIVCLWRWLFIASMCVALDEEKNDISSFAWCCCCCCMLLCDNSSYFFSVRYHCLFRCSFFPLFEMLSILAPVLKRKYSSFISLNSISFDVFSLSLFSLFLFLSRSLLVYVCVFFRHTNRNDTLWPIKYCSQRQNVSSCKRLFRVSPFKRHEKRGAANEFGEKCMYVCKCSNANVCMHMKNNQGEWWIE